MIITLEQAIKTILENTKSSKKISILNIENIDGHILAKDIFTNIDTPPFDRSPLDGYALISSDISLSSIENPVNLKVIDTIFAGNFTSKEVKSGECVKIMTGAPIPKNCDCIIRQENTNYGESEVLIYEKLSHHENYCFAGEDIKKGVLLIKKGTKLDYRHIGVLASQGISKVSVFSKINIMLVTTGDELCDIDVELEYGKIYNSNIYLLKHRLLNLGVNVKAFNVGDNPEEAAKLIENNYLDFDAIITTGGVSVGVKDIIHNVIKILGIDRIFWKIKIKPGTPVIFSKYKDLPILSLSGNPFASFVTFELLARPMIAKIMNDNSFNFVKTKGVMKEEFLKSSPSRRFIRAYFDNEDVYINNVNHSSGSISDIVNCNCLIDIEDGNKGLKIGDIVDIVLF